MINYYYYYYYNNNDRLPLFEQACRRAPLSRASDRRVDGLSALVSHLLEAMLGYVVLCWIMRLFLPAAG